MAYHSRSATAVMHFQIGVFLSVSAPMTFGLLRLLVRLPASALLALDPDRKSCFESLGSRHLELQGFPWPKDVTFHSARDGDMISRHVGAADWSAPSVIAFISKLKAP